MGLLKRKKPKAAAVALADGGRPYMRSLDALPTEARSDELIAL